MRPHQLHPVDVRVDPVSGFATITIGPDPAGKRLLHDLLNGQAGGHRFLLVPDVLEVRSAMRALDEWPEGMAGPPCEFCRDGGMRAYEIEGGGFGDGPCECEAGQKWARQLEESRSKRKAGGDTFCRPVL